MIAKSNPQISIHDHSKLVAKFSEKILNNISDKHIIEDWSNTIKYAALLHDIGKLTTQFQLVLLGKRKSTKYKYTHNEIGWAFLSQYLSPNFPNKDIILNIVHWHHGIYSKQNSSNDLSILGGLEEQSLSNMLNYLEEIVGVHNVCEPLDTPETSPSFYPEIKKDNISANELQLCRNIVISADRLSSTKGNIDDLVDQYLNREIKDITIGGGIYKESDRFKTQKAISEECLGSKISIPKAPAGFGKTVLGLLWALSQKRKALWVLPRNSISYSLYESVLKELKNLGLENISVQLILSGEIKNNNDDSKGLYEADLIITNIDNFLSPDFKNSVMDSSGLLLGCSVIFDEFHELVTESALMSLFVLIMKSRFLLTNSKTLLLSATPIKIDFLWNYGRPNEINILPNLKEHYKAPHNKKYLIKVLKSLPDINNNQNTLVIKNTINSAQEQMKTGRYGCLIHSNFTEDHKRDKIKHIIKNYGKKSELNKNKENIISTHVIQASMDISFSKLYENVLSPETSLQRIGRINRWGNLDDGCEINIIRSDSPSQSETMIGRVLYNNDLSLLWYNFIGNEDGKLLTLDEIYVLYNKFSEINERAIKRFVAKRYSSSLKRLYDIYPIRFKETNLKKGGVNKLRQVNNQIYYTVENSSGDWVGPFNKPIYSSFDDDFKEEGKSILKRMIETMKVIMQSKNTPFDYSDIINKAKYQTITNIRNKSLSNLTPYISYNMKYDDKLGIIE